MTATTALPKQAPWFYRVLLILVVPLALIRLWWRGRRQPGYRQHIAERFGFGTLPAGGPVIWLHAVSVGETRAAEPLVQALLTTYPAHRLLITHMTPTGRATSTALFRHPRVLIRYVPYDLTSAVERFLRQFNPVCGLLMETEIWPNLILRSRTHQIPILLINARLSARSARRYAKFAGVIRPILQALSAVAAQTTEDSARLAQLGAPAPCVTGNLKFDVAVDPKLTALGQHWRDQIHVATPQRLIWMAASTRDGEETLILEAHRILCQTLAQNPPLLVLVPRHPQRFNDVANQIQQAGFIVERRTHTLPNNTTQVWLGDSMGEMVAYYHLADVAVMGGTLLPFGGQNLIEAAACGTPVILGPHTYNFSAAAQTALQTGAATGLEAVTPEALAQTVERFLADMSLCQSAQQATHVFIQAATGATEKTMGLIQPYLHR